MQEIVKKFLDLGLETQSRMADFLTSILSKARMDEEERKRFVAELEQKFEHSREKGEKLLHELSEKIPGPLHLTKHKELEELKKKVEELEERIKALEPKP
jgi:polyhydroxyalkanoate synthesis regulator phasin